MQEQIEQTLTSMEVAEMVGKTHANLLKDIRGYIAQLAEVKSYSGDEVGELKMSAPTLGRGSELKIEAVDFFKESTYLDKNQQERPCYNITKKGCEFIAHKLTGIKGTVFTAQYINRFHDMENVVKAGISKKSENGDKLHIMEMNARSRMAQTYLKLAQIDTLSPTYKNVLASKASEVLAGEPIIPLPKIGQKKVYTAQEIGNMFGISANKVGRIANQNNLKTEANGEYRRDKSKHSAHECDAWVYFASAIPEFERIIAKEKEQTQ